MSLASVRDAAVREAGSGRRASASVAVLALLLLGACASAGGGAAPTIESATFAPSLGVDLAASTRGAGGYYYRDLVPGQGDEVRTGRRVTVRYTGWLPNGTPVEAGEPATVSFRVGAREVIPGWDRGVVGMRTGGQRQLVLPGALGYGPRAYKGVPPNAVLVFLIDVLDVR